MGQDTWKTGRTGVGKNLAADDVRQRGQVESDPEREAYLERLRMEIVSGTYQVPAEGLAAKLVRRIRWW